MAILHKGEGGTDGGSGSLLAFTLHETDQQWIRVDLFYGGSLDSWFVKLLGGFTKFRI